MGVMCVISSDATLFNIVVFPELSRPNNKILSSFCGSAFNFLNRFNNPWNKNEKLIKTYQKLDYGGGGLMQVFKDTCYALGKISLKFVKTQCINLRGVFFLLPHLSIDDKNHLRIPPCLFQNFIEIF